MRKIYLIIVILVFTVCSNVNAQSLFSDSFDSGLNTAVWDVEDEGGASWFGASGHIQSQPQLASDRYLDVLTKQSNFTNYILNFDINFQNNKTDQDWRRIYLRANGTLENHSGYAINIRNYDDANVYDFVGLGPYTNTTLDIEPQAFAQEFNPLLNNVWYRFEVLMNENNLKLKYWDVSNAEPSSWLIEVSDPSNSYTSGRIGFGNYWNSDTLIDNVKVSAVPEPATMLLFGTGMIGAFVRRRKK